MRALWGPLASDKESGRIAGLAAVMALILAGLSLFHNDVTEVLGIWAGSSAYGYCPLVPLVSLMLIAARRAELRQTRLMPSWSGAALWLVGLALWALGQATAMAEIRQFAIVLLLQAAVLCLCGWQIYRKILFPMLYLFLMVPSATPLLAPLQVITTLLAAALLRLSGIPVLVEQHLIQVPHGLYQVAPGCAGLNFLLSSLALSLVYAALLYRGTAKRLACVLLAVLLSIATNGLRVFGIIWLAEATERRIDIVDDHLLYGWAVYFVAMLAAMAFGLRFKDPPTAERAVPEAGRPGAAMPGLWLLAVTLALAAGATDRVMAATTPPVRGVVQLRRPIPDTIGAWRLVDGDAALALPLALQEDARARLVYAKAGRRIEVAIAYYWRQRDGHKVSDVATELVSQAARWRVLGQGRETVQLGRTLQTLETTLVDEAGGPRLVWSYDWVGGRITGSLLAARLLGGVGRLGGDGRSAIVMLSALDDNGVAPALLADFCDDADLFDPVLAGAVLIAP